MPTPFMHLQMAERVRESSSLPPALRVLIEDAWPAFYFGNVAPDYQAICHIPRENTHFYTLPPDPQRQPYDVMWQRYPALASPAKLPRDQALFVAGYAAHLMLDIVWFNEVVISFFAGRKLWTNHQERRVVHFILLTHLDKMAFGGLPDSAAQTLAAAKIEKWLPFARDEDLIDWQAMLQEQLRPGGLLKTVEIYAERVGLSTEAFRNRLDDAAWMRQQLFQKVPVGQVERLLTRSVDATIQLLEGFLLEP